MLKIDLKKQFDYLYHPPTGKVVLIDVPEMNFLMIDGMGNPNTTQEYKDVVDALYNLAYTRKFMIKKGQALDYPVMPLEGLWWTKNRLEFSMDSKDIWHWTMMSMQSEYGTQDLLDEASEQGEKRKDVPALSLVRLERFHEGLSAQIMHVGPYAAEAPTSEKLHAFIKDHGYVLRGKPPEIYLGDPRRTALEKLRTVLRQPVKGEKEHE